MSNMARMDDLISREAVKEQAKASYHVAESMEQLGNLYEDCINALPSAFEGMTVGEALKAVFPNAVIRTDDSRLIVEVLFSNEVWNAPYKAESEANKTYQEQCKGDTTWGSSTRALKR